MTHRVRLLSLSIAAACLCAAVAFADHHEGKSEGTAGGMSPEQIQEYMAKVAVPGPEHKYFDYFIGDWTFDNTMYMGDEPMTSKGSATWGWKLGGRYVESTYTGDFMGQPFTGWGVDGYDRANQSYFSLWFDTAGTGYMAGHGVLSKDGKTLTTSGTMMDPMVGAEVAHRSVTTIVDKDHFTFVMFQTMPGQEETKAMEMNYTRAKSAAN